MNHLSRSLYWFASRILLVLILLISTHTQTKHLIFDLTYTLIEPSKTSVAAHLGSIDCSAFWLKHGSKCHSLLNDTLIKVLGHNETNNTKKNQTTASNACKETGLVPCDASGKPMPRLMCEWLKGTRTCKLICSDSLAKCKEYPSFLDKRHKRITTRMIEWMFNPRHFAHSMTIMPSASRIVRECISAKDKTGKPKHTLYILSNMDPESYEYLKKARHLSPLFRQFDPKNIIISGHIKDLKPRRSIFKTLLEKYKLDPKECILFDDQAENRQAAQLLGITPFEFTHNYTKDRKKLKKMGVL